MNLPPTERRPRLVAFLGSRLPADYDCRRGNHPDLDRFFRFLEGFGGAFDVRLLAMFPVPERLLPGAEIRLLPRTASKLWTRGSLALARAFGLSGIDWDEVAEATAPSTIVRILGAIRRSDALFVMSAVERAWLFNTWARALGKVVVYDSFDDYVEAVLGARHRQKGVWPVVRGSIHLAVAWVAAWMAMAAATLTTVVNDGHAALVRRRYGVPRRKLQVVNPAIEEGRPGVPAARRDFGLEDGDFVVGYMGNFRTGSNREALAGLQREIAPALDAHPRIRFLVMGDVPAELDAARPNLRYAGFVREIDAVLPLCDMAISPVAAVGGLIEMKVLHYLRHGLPVLCTAERGNRFESEAVILRPRREFAAEIGRLFLDPAERRRLAEAARAYYAAHYSRARHDASLAELVARTRAAAARRG
jgi:glycosyltransferase involved in cell wall biosynthesis